MNGMLPIESPAIRPRLDARTKKQGAPNILWRHEHLRRWPQGRHDLLSGIANLDVPNSSCEGTRPENAERDQRPDRKNNKNGNDAQSLHMWSAAYLLRLIFDQTSVRLECIKGQRCLNIIGLCLRLHRVTPVLQSFLLQPSQERLVVTPAPHTEHFGALHRLNHALHLILRRWLMIDVAMVRFVGVLERIRGQRPRQVARDAALVLDIEVARDGCGSGFFSHIITARQKRCKSDRQFQKVLIRLQ